MGLLNAHWLSEVVWKREVTLEDRAFRWGRLGNDYVGQWDDVLVVRVDAAGRTTTVRPNPNTPSELVEKIANGEAAAFARAIAGGFSIHAAAVAFGPCAVALTGASGVGKSTLASSLCDFSGASLLADDVAGLATSQGRLFVEPSERFVWLDGGDGAKVPTLRRCATEPTRLIAVVSLDTDARSPALRRITGPRVVTCVLDSLLRFNPASELWAREFDAIATLATTIPVWELSRGGRTPKRLAECIARLVHPTSTFDEP
jgi:hypothetical protein